MEQGPFVLPAPLWNISSLFVSGRLLQQQLSSDFWRHTFLIWPFLHKYLHTRLPACWVLVFRTVIRISAFGHWIGWCATEPGFCRGYWPNRNIVDWFSVNWAENAVWWKKIFYFTLNSPPPSSDITILLQLCVCVCVVCLCVQGVSVSAEGLSGYSSFNTSLS